MSLNSMQQQILSPFVEQTVKSLEVMAGLNARVADPFQDDVESFGFQGYAVATNTWGKLSGFILLHVYVESALLLAAQIRKTVLGVDEKYEEINDHVMEALSEWANTVIGRATDYLVQANLGIRFQPPMFILDTTQLAPLLIGTKEILSIPVHFGKESRVYLNYLLHNNTKA